MNNPITHLKSFLIIGVFLGAAAAAHAEKFSIVILPDTQYYTDSDECRDKDIYLHQAQ